MTPVTAGAVDFPGGEAGRPSTPTVTGVLADAVRRLDPGLAEEIASARRWRSQYVGLVRRLTELCASSPEAAVTMAGDGLVALHQRMVVTGREGDRPLQTLEAPSSSTLSGLTVRGAQPRQEELRLPYRGQLLTGDRLRAQLERWVAAGTVEPSCAEAVGRVLDRPEWLALPGRQVVLLGAAAALSPLSPLSRWGADVVAVDVPVPAVQDRLCCIAEAGAGSVTVPVRAGAGRGADLLTESLDLVAWLRGSTSGALVLASAAYAPGAVHVRVNAAVDLLTARLVAGHHPGVVLASLATPTDAFAVPPEVVDAARAAQSRRGGWTAESLHRLTGGRVLAPSYPARLPDGRGIADGLVPQQGPGYALAKRIERWRAVAHEAAGGQVSVNVAPATWTRSVTSDRLLAAAYAGAPRFGLEIFAPETSRVLMAALLVHDVSTPAPRRRHPEELFSAGAAHGGSWRAAYRPRSVLGLAALLGTVSTMGGRKPPA